MIEGVSQLSIGKFKNNEFNIEKEYKDFNGFIFVRESLSNYNDKTFAMVKCTDENKNCKVVFQQCAHLIIAKFNSDINGGKCPCLIY